MTILAQQLLVQHIEEGGADWWDPDGEGLSAVAAYRAKGAVNYAATLINLANPGTYNLVEGNGTVPWSAGNGWEFTAADSKYFDAGFVPEPGAATRTWTLLLEYAGASDTLDGWPCGARSSIGTTNFFALRNRYEVGRSYYYNGVAVYESAKYLSGNRGFAGVDCYRDGVDTGVDLGAKSAAVDLSFYIGCYHNTVGPAAGYATINIGALVVYDVTLTAGQVAAVAAAMGAL